MLPFLLAAAAGGVIVKNMTDYPPDIRNLRRQIPKEERDDFIREYKGLSRESKTQFKQYLREANLAEAGKVIGRDLSGFVANAKAKKSATTPEQAPVSTETPDDNGFNTRIKNILNSYPLESDPQLVADAAKRYESIADYNQLNIVDKTRKILDVSQ